MDWQLVSAPAPTMKFVTMGGHMHARWNNATQRMMGYPRRVDFLYAEDEQQIAFRLGGQYLVYTIDDELCYDVIISGALAAIGVEIPNNYEATPQMVDLEEAEASGTVNAVYVPLPPV